MSAPGSLPLLCGVAALGWGRVAEVLELDRHHHAKQPVKASLARSSCHLGRCAALRCSARPRSRRRCIPPSTFNWHKGRRRRRQAWWPCQLSGRCASGALCPAVPSACPEDGVPGSPSGRARFSSDWSWWARSEPKRTWPSLDCTSHRSVRPWRHDAEPDRRRTEQGDLAQLGAVSALGASAALWAPSGSASWAPCFRWEPRGTSRRVCHGWIRIGNRANPRSRPGPRPLPSA